MANPTTNFGWQMPTSTDLVTDLPADFETFGQAVDTTLVDLKGGTTGQILSKASATDMDFTWVAPTTGDITGVSVTSPITGGGTSGDVTIGISSSAIVPSQTGNSGKYLTTDGTTSSWGTISAGGMTLLSTTTFNNTVSTYTLSSISGSYKHLFLTGTGLQSAGTGANLNISVRANGDTGSNYWWSWVANDVGSITANGTAATTEIQTGYPLARSGDTAIRFGNWSMTITDYASSTLYKGFQANGGSAPAGSPSNYATIGGWNSTAAITSLTLFSVSNFKAGTIKLWGMS